MATWDDEVQKKLNSDIRKKLLERRRAAREERGEDPEDVTVTADPQAARLARLARLDAEPVRQYQPGMPKRAVRPPNGSATSTKPSAKPPTMAVDPTTAPGPVRTLADMTPEEIVKLEALYGPITPRPLKP